MIFHIFPCIFTTYGYTTNSQRDQLPDGLIAQLVEQVGHGLESRLSPNQLFHSCLSCVYNRDDQ